MSQVLARNWGNNVVYKRGAVFKSGSLVLKKKKQGVVREGKASLKTVVLAMAMLLVLFGVLYLYQVNNIAIRGYEVRDIENRIQDLQKENQKLKIQEVESKSMYNIEKATEDLNLVNSSNVSYVEMRGPMAMK
jgi:hypothetical protein